MTDSSSCESIESNTVKEIKTKLREIEVQILAKQMNIKMLEYIKQKSLTHKKIERIVILRFVLTQRGKDEYALYQFMRTNPDAVWLIENIRDLRWAIAEIMRTNKPTVLCDRLRIFRKRLDRLRQSEINRLRELSENTGNTNNQNTVK